MNIRRARVRLAGLPPSSERELDFVYLDDFGRFCSDALVAVTRGRHGREIYAAALGVPARDFAPTMRLDERHIRRFRRLPAEIIAWAERPELGWRGFGLTADQTLWDPDWVQAAQDNSLPVPPLPSRPSLVSGLDLAAVIGDLVDDPELLEPLRDHLAALGHRGSDWLAGGCLILAEGARRAIGGTLQGVADDDQCDCGDLDHHTVEHVVLRLRDGRFLDAQGVHDDAEAVRASLRDVGYHRPSLTPFHLADARTFGIPFDAGLALRLERRIRLELAGR